jgi:hypothetical protein
MSHWKVTFRGGLSESCGYLGEEHSKQREQKIQRPRGQAKCQGAVSKILWMKLIEEGQGSRTRV